MSADWLKSMFLQLDRNMAHVFYFFSCAFLKFQEPIKKQPSSASVCVKFAKSTVSNLARV